MHLRVRGDPDREAAGGCNVVDQVQCVRVVPSRGAAINRQVPTKRENILDTYPAVADEQPGNVGSGMSNAREMRQSVSRQIHSTTSPVRCRSEPPAP